MAISGIWYDIHVHHQGTVIRFSYICFLVDLEDNKATRKPELKFMFKNNVPKIDP